MNNTQASFIILASLLSLSTYANENCKLYAEELSWSGACENGYANGVGELSYKQPNQGDTVKTFGKVSDGVITGLHLTVMSTYPDYLYSTFYIKGSPKHLGPTIVTVPDSKNLPIYKRAWTNINSQADAKGNLPDISYDEALNLIKTYLTQASDPSMSFEIFKAYLEGRVRVTGEDDPPVFGAELKPSDGKKVKK